MKDTGLWVVGIVILLALFNKKCDCVAHLAPYLDQPVPTQGR